MPSETATAHAAWDERWKTADGRADWIDPAIDVRWCARRLLRQGATRALDLGCGVGRHALYLAALGFEVQAMDGAAAGIDHLLDQARSLGLNIEGRSGLMTELPYEDGWFDYVLAYNVIYHGDGAVVRRTLEEIHRVLKPGGTYQGTMLAKRNVTFGRGREIAPNTFVIEDGPSDKAHPHFYCDLGEIAALHAGFEIASVFLQEDRDPGSWHWHLVAEKRPQADAR